MNEEKEFILIYNADSGKWNGYMDMMHKVFSPKTYPCHLCAITYGVFKIEDDWKEFISEYPVPLVFLHRDEWLEQHSFDTALPAIVERNSGGYKVILSPEEMNTMDLPALKLFMKKMASSATA